MVNMELGICSCNAGCYGSPRSAAIVKHYHKPSVNYIPSLSADSRELVANIALGQQVIKAPPFYASLHEKTLCQSSRFWWLLQRHFYFKGLVDITISLLKITKVVSKFWLSFTVSVWRQVTSALYPILNLF